MSIRWSRDDLEAASIDRDRLMDAIASIRYGVSQLAEMRCHIYSALGQGVVVHESRPLIVRSDPEVVAVPDAIVAWVGPGFYGGGRRDVHEAITAGI